MSCSLATKLGALVLALTASFASAQSADTRRAVPHLGGLVVAPTRVVFEGRTRTAALTLRNSGSETATYRISFAEMHMTEMGDLIEVPQGQPATRSAAAMVRYSPRQVTLDPGAIQTVRLQLRKPSDLATGEYRSHLVFRAVPVTEGAAPTARASEVERGVDIKLTALYGVSIPVIVRHGETVGKVSLSGLNIQPATEGSGRMLGLKLERTGDRSVYGDLVITWITVDGRRIRAGLYKGVAIYATNSVRRVRVPLPESIASNASGRLLVEFTEPGGGSTLAEAALQLR